MINKEIATSLKVGDYLYSSLELDSRGNPRKVRVNGKCKIWKRRPNDFKLPVKYGLYTCWYIENDQFAAHWHISEEDAIAAYPSGKIESERYVDTYGRIIQSNTVVNND